MLALALETKLIADPPLPVTSTLEPTTMMST
jgi:hypothetical protein